MWERSIRAVALYLKARRERWRLGPPDFPEPIEQLGAAIRIQTGDLCDSPPQRFTKTRVTLSVLRLRPQANAIGQDGSQRFIVSPWYVQMLVHDQPQNLLSTSAAHRTRFAKVHRESLVDGDCCRRCRESERLARKIIATAKHQVVSRLRTRPVLTDPKKSFKSMRRTTPLPTCGRAAVTTPRDRRKPWAASWIGI